MTAPVGIAIVGVGRMGGFHARTLAAASAAGVLAVDVVAIVDASDTARSGVLAAIKADAPGTIGVATIAEALALPGVEACLIATPTPTHAALVDAVLDAGVHVLCEKPLSLDPAASRRLGERASSLGLVLQVGFWRRFSPPWAAAKRAIERGDIGRPLYLRLCQWDADPPPPAFCDPTVSGGLAVDCGVHEVDLAEWLTGSTIERVHAWAPPPVPGGVAEVGDLDNLVAVAELANGAVATIDLSRNGRYGDDVRTEVLGTDGALLVELLPSGRTRLGTRAGLAEIEGSQVDDATAAGVVGQMAAFTDAVRRRTTASAPEPIPVADLSPDLPGAEASARATAHAQAIHAALPNRTASRQRAEGKMTR